MASKLGIFLVFVGLAQTSVGSDVPGTCAPSPEIKEVLKSIKFAETTERLGYLRSAEVIVAEISAVLAQKLGGGDIEPEDENMRTEMAKNGSFTGPMNAVRPNSQAIRIIQPDFDMMTFQQTQSAGRWKLNQEIFDGIKAAQGSDLQKAKDDIAKHSKSAHDIASSGVKQFFSSMTNGSKSIPDNGLSTISCMQSETETMVTSALDAIFEEINILAEALNGNDNSKEKIEKDLMKILESHGKAISGFSTGIGYKFQVLKNIALQQYLNRIEIVTALFAIESAVAF